MRAHQRRTVDLRRGQRLGHEDHVVPWSKPTRPAWMDEATYAGLPATVERREVRVRVTQRGFRTRVVLVATTLRDAQAFTKEELAGLYRARWHAALDRRAIKQTMQMDGLRCKTPEMVRKELWGPLLVYNLLRAAYGPGRPTAGDVATPGAPTRSAPDAGSLSQSIASAVPYAT
jgi:hypothetical protein